jgi:SulP family sulfate permease
VLKDAFDQIGPRRRAYILRLEETPMVDPTGAFALGDFLKRVLDDGAEVSVCGASRAVMRSLLKTIEPDLLRQARFVGTFDEARRTVTGR